MSEVRNCPICGGELEKGFVYSDRGIFWNKKEHEFIKFWEKSGEKLVWSFSRPTMPSASGWRCQKCRLVLFHY